ncbi:MAG: carbamoyl-phosphate synthase large subunit, partial [Verrucomicrobiales bacterium]
VARELVDLGFTIWATGGTYKRLKDEKIPCERLFKLNEQRRPNVVDMMKNGEIDFIINTPSDSVAREDEVKIRSTAVTAKVSHATNLSAAEACVKAIRSLKEGELEVKPLQEFHQG